MKVFVDLETTGVDPEHDEILEVGIVITTDDYVPYATWTGWIAYMKPLSTWDPYVQNMHTNSGLLYDLDQHARPSLDVEDEAIAFLSGFGVNPTAEMQNRPSLYGNTVHFDREFMRIQLPRLWALFHYRNVDITTIKSEVYEMTGMRIGELVKANTNEHRAVDDCLHAISEFRYWRKWAGNLVGSPVDKTPVLQGSPS